MSGEVLCPVCRGSNVDVGDFDPERSGTRCHCLYCHERFLLLPPGFDFEQAYLRRLEWRWEDERVLKALGMLGKDDPS